MIFCSLKKIQITVMFVRDKVIGQNEKKRQGFDDLHGYSEMIMVM